MRDNSDVLTLLYDRFNDRDIESAARTKWNNNDLGS